MEDIANGIKPQAQQGTQAPSDLFASLNQAGVRERAEGGDGDGGERAEPAPHPRAPASLTAVGLSTSFLLELALKVLHYSDNPTAEHIARVMAIPINQVNELLEVLKAEHLCEIVSGSNYQLATAYRFRLTEKGEMRAEQALERCRYAGAAPVTVEQYERVIGQTDAVRWRPAIPVIQEAFRELVLDPKTADFLERALHSGRSAMIYGPSGNGKTHILTEFVKRLGGDVLMPHALYAYGQIIRIYDPLVHIRIDGPQKNETAGGDGLAFGTQAKPGDDNVDRRWVRVRRPGLIVGGEFTPESLELGYDPVTRFYQAPKHLKAQGGVLVVDDFGRQKVSPADLLNRWIMALERGRDNLLLRTGESIDIPFHITLLFSTNLNPSDLADSAYMRRIPYKAYMPPAAPERFAEILKRVITEAGCQVSGDEVMAIASFLDEATSHELSGSLARDLVMVMTDNALHEGRAPVFDLPNVELAYRQFTGIPEDAPLTPASLATNR
jgi:predicted ATPase with chaperone activity